MKKLLLLILVIPVLLAFAKPAPQLQAHIIPLGTQDKVEIPWRVSGQIYGSDYVEYRWQLGNEEVSVNAGCGDPPSYALPPWDPTLGTLVAVQGGMDIETNWGSKGECDTDGTYQYPNVQFNLVGSWNPQKHDGRWWPYPSEVGQPGDTIWEVEFLFGDKSLGETRDRAPIGFIYADDGRRPRSLFDGKLDFKGTSGGSWTEHKPAEPLIWGPIRSCSSVEDATFLILAQGSIVCNIVGRIHIGWDGHAILHGGVRYYFR